MGFFSGDMTYVCQFFREMEALGFFHSKASTHLLLQHLTTYTTKEGERYTWRLRTTMTRGGLLLRTFPT
jgi:hypothetical protein